MPAYDFKCNNQSCGKEFSVILDSWKDENPKCECGSKTERLMGSPGLFWFKKEASSGFAVPKHGGY